jgi:2-hydroxychromene-2-carboxylate isomerase
MMRPRPAKPDAIFYYDFNSPYAYLAAERLDDFFPQARWRPVAFAFLLRAQRRTPWSFTDKAAAQAEIGRRAAERGLPPLAWRTDWPVDCYSLDPLRAAWVAAEHGLLRQFSVAAFRRLFVDGLALGGEVTLALAESVGLNRDEMRQAMSSHAKQRLQAATDQAIADGIPGVPTLTLDGRHFWGDDQLEAAAATARPG